MAFATPQAAFVVAIPLQTEYTNFFWGGIDMRIRIACECSKRFSVDEKHLGENLLSVPDVRKNTLSLPAQRPPRPPRMTAKSWSHHSPPMPRPSFLAASALFCSSASSWSWSSSLAYAAPVRQRRNPSLSLASKTPEEKKLPPPVVKLAPVNQEKKPAGPVEQAKQTPNRKSPARSKRRSPIEAGPLRFRLGMTRTASDKKPVRLRWPVADKAPVPYKVRRLKPSDSPERKRLRPGAHFPRCMTIWPSCLTRWAMATVTTG